MSRQTRLRGGPNVLLGMVRVARGRSDGLEQFGNTKQAFLASLAPLLAFPLVGGGRMLATGAWHQGLTDLGAAVCAILAPAILSYEFARAWGRLDRWPRYATAFNWCQWLLPLLAAVVLMVMGGAVGAGLSEQTAAGVVLLVVGCYALWLHWFLVRHGLGLGGGRAALMVAGVNLGTAILIAGPILLSRFG